MTAVMTARMRRSAMRQKKVGRLHPIQGEARPMGCLQGALVPQRPTAKAVTKLETQNASLFPLLLLFLLLLLLPPLLPVEGKELSHHYY